MNMEDFENNFMGKPIRNGFEEYSLPELQQMIKENIQCADAGDMSFIKRIRLEIARRKRYHD